MPPHTCGTDKDFGGVKMTGAVVFEGRENDVLFAKQGTRREVHASLWLRQQRRYDMQRIGDDMQPKVAEMRAHLQCRRAAIDDDRLAGFAKLRRGFSNGHFCRTVLFDIFVEG